MSEAMWAHLVIACMERQEPCIPDPVEPWFSVNFVCQVLGYESSIAFVRKLTAAQIPRHPMQAKCIGFSDLHKGASNGKKATGGR